MLMGAGIAFTVTSGRPPLGPDLLLAAVVNTTVVAVKNLTVGSTVWLPAESSALPAGD